MTALTPEILAATEHAFAADYGLPAPPAALLQIRWELSAATPWQRTALWLVAPVLAGFAAWLADAAARHPGALMLGVMREGRLLTRLLAPLLPRPPQEIWLNRKLSMLAAFGAGDDEALLNWLVRTRMQPLRRNAALRELTGGAPTGTGDLLLDLAAAQTLLADPAVRDPARARAQELGQRLLHHWQRYVPSGSPAPVLLADFASVGNIQRSLRALLQARGETDRMIGLNFVTTAGTKWAQAQGCVLHGYLAEDGAPAWLTEAYARTPELIEIFTAAPLGPLEDYAPDGAPCTGSTFLSAPQTMLLEETQRAIVQAAALYQAQLGAALTPALGQCLWGRLLLRPMPEEAAALGDWPLDAGLDGAAQRTLAPILSGTAEPWHKMQTAWPAASRLRSGQGTACNKN